MTVIPTPANVPTFSANGHVYMLWPTVNLAGDPLFSLGVQQPDGSFNEVANTQEMWTDLGSAGHQGLANFATWSNLGDGTWARWAYVLRYCGPLGPLDDVGAAQSWMVGKDMNFIISTIMSWITGEVLPALNHMLATFFGGAAPVNIQPDDVYKALALHLRGTTTTATYAP